MCRINWKYFLVIVLMLICGSLLLPSTVSADVTDSYNESSENEDLDGYSMSDADEDEDTENEAEETRYKYVLGFGFVAIAAMALLCLAKYRKKQKEAQKQLEHLEDFGQLYDKFKRYYAYCAEQIRRAENNGAAYRDRDILTIKEEVKDIYNRMNENKIQFDHLKDSVSPDLSQRRELLCKKARNNVRRLENYLTDLCEKSGKAMS